MPSVVPFAFTIKIHLDQEITDNNCRCVQIYNDIHIIRWHLQKKMAVLIIKN